MGKAENQVKQDPVSLAVNQIAETEAGTIFFRWLARRCFFDHSTIVGNPQSYEVNTVGTVSQEFLRRLYLDIRRHMDKKIRQKIEQ